MTRSFSYIGALIAAGWKGRFRSPQSVFILALLMFVQNLFFIVLWRIFFSAVPEIGGWTFQDMSILLGIFSLALGLSFLFLSGIRHIPFYIKDGSFDLLLTRPRHPLGQIMFSAPSIANMGDLCTSLFCAFCLAHLSSNAFVIFLLAGFLAGLIIASMMVLIFSLPLFSLRSQTIVDQLLDSFLILSTVPHLHGSWLLQTIIFSVLPAGFIGLLPVELVRSPTASHLGLLFVATVSYIAVAILVFNAGVRAYRGQNPLFFRAFG